MEDIRENVISLLETIDIETGKREVLHEFHCLIEAPNFLETGKNLIYNRAGKLFKYNIENQMESEINTGYCDRLNNDHVLSPDKKSIGLSHQTFEDGKSRIYTFSFDDINPRLITPLGFSYLHGWSPDGTTLCYCAERKGEFDVYTIPAEGGIETRLTHAPGLSDGPEYSPCGKYIWFNSVRTGLMQIWRMNKDGSNKIQMTKDERNNWFPHISPDGSKVVYLSYKKGDVDSSDHPANKNVELRLISSEGGEPRILTSLFGGQGTINVNSWSPDNKKIAFISYRLK